MRGGAGTERRRGGGRERGVLFPEPCPGAVMGEPTAALRRIPIMYTPEERAELAAREARLRAKLSEINIRRGQREARDAAVEAQQGARRAESGMTSHSPNAVGASTPADFTRRPQSEDL